jgi:hypothetical protein
LGRLGAELVLGEGPPEQALRRWHASDLYLACGCAGADAAALLQFERRFLS